MRVGLLISAIYLLASCQRAGGNSVSEEISDSVPPVFNETEFGNPKHGAIHVASWKFEYVNAPLIFTGFVVLICLLKLIYHHMAALAALIPESCLLILLGVLIGFLFWAEEANKILSFLQYDERSFFLFLLPPIMLEAAYSLRDRAFLENLGTIAVFAVVGTIINTFFVASMLFFVSYLGNLGISFVECLIFSSLIAAVDPVAVLSVFQELCVNKMLYFLVFGESLFNDAVTVVMYNIAVAFTNIERIRAEHILTGLAAFFCVGMGGIVIGIFYGILTCLITKYTEHSRLIEPVILLALAYLSYLTAEMIHFSGIISIIFCGLVQGYYAMENISSRSYISVVYFSKVTSSVVESLIFIILGVMLVNQSYAWNHWSTAFAMWSLFVCLLSRFIVVFGITFVINSKLKGIRRVTYEEQFIMAYGGLRGAISFSLVFMLNVKEVPSKFILLTTTYFIILFTVFVQGISIKPLVGLMRIKLDVQDSSIFKEINRGLIGNTMAGFEEITGHRGTNYWTLTLKRFSQKVLRPIFQKDPVKRSNNLMQLYQEGALQQQLSSSTSRADMQLSALWYQLDNLDSTAVSGSICELILQGQDDFTEGQSLKKLRDKPDSIELEKIKTRRRKRHLKSIGTPRELLMFRNMLDNQTYKTIHYTHSRDYVSPMNSRRPHPVNSLALLARDRLRRDVMRKRSMQVRSSHEGAVASDATGADLRPRSQSLVPPEEAAKAAAAKLPPVHISPIVESHEEEGVSLPDFKFDFDEPPPENGAAGGDEARERGKIDEPAADDKQTTC